MDIKKYKTPLSRDPFPNTPLIPVGIDPETNEERFWITSWNANVGCLGVLVTPSGKNRIYHFKKSHWIVGCGAYSAVYTGDDTLWLMSDLAAFIRLDLRSGKYEEYETGAKSGLVFAGMQYDEATGKLIAFANTNPEFVGVSFDTNTKTTSQLYKGFTSATLANGGFKNPDGTYTICFVEGDKSLWRWIPKTDELTRICSMPEDFACHSIEKKICYKGLTYIPFYGWFDGYNTCKLPKPERDMVWFGIKNDLAYGICDNHIYTWNLKDGTQRILCDAQNYGYPGISLTDSGDIVAVNTYGEFSRIRGSDGALLHSTRLATDSYGTCDCIVASDEDIIIGTPFITQRFWIYNEKTNIGYDAGKASPGGGEVMRAWNLCGKIYMASYTEGVLTEFDPYRLANFPENPRVVAAAPRGMRPVAHAQNDTSLFYSSNHHYGTLGCVLAKYDTLTQLADYNDEPLRAQHIISLLWLESQHCLIGGTTYISDCHATHEADNRCYIVFIDSDTLEITSKFEAPLGTLRANVIGNMDSEHCLAAFDKDEHIELASFNIESKTFNVFGTMPQKVRKILYTGIYGMYIMLRDGNTELWEITSDKVKCLSTILCDSEVYNIFINPTAKGLTLCAAKPSEFFVIRNFM